MTCIVALKDKHNSIWVGGDAIAYEEKTGAVDSRVQPKVWIKEDMIYGFAGSFRVGQIIQYDFVPPKRDVDTETYEYMVTKFVTAIRKILAKNGALSKEENADCMPYSSSVIIGYDGKIYMIYDDFDVGEIHGGFAALGAGEPYAIGSLSETKHLSSKKRVKRALKVAATYCSGVGPPFVIKCLESPIS